KLHDQKRAELYGLVTAARTGEDAQVRMHQAEATRLLQAAEGLRTEAKALIRSAVPTAETNDKDYVFMGFVMGNLPIGMIGLLFAVMFCAAMSSTASELNALASTTTIDLYKRSVRKHADERHYLRSSKLFTLAWGLLAILFATYASLFENLIQAVNLLGSLFYGTILGIFLVAFYCKSIQGHAVFLAALLAEALVVWIHFANAAGTAPGWLTMGYLWYNAVGCGLVIALGYLLQPWMPKAEPPIQRLA
ncbi:MAG TPA: sodium:solute symporter, partial [Planctomycetota bacterium]|nr:sodium:solute symporter [Planctomycetota bacterium]